MQAAEGFIPTESQFGLEDAGISPNRVCHSKQESATGCSGDSMKGYDIHSLIRVRLSEHTVSRTTCHASSGNE